MENVVIYGETAFAERIYSYIKFEKSMNVIAFTNAKAFKEKDSIQGIPVIAFEELNEKLGSKDFGILIAVGYVQMNNIRKKIYKECKDAGHRIATYISQASTLYSDDIGEGCIIMPNVYIGPGVKIGKCNIFESSTCLTHDNLIGDFNFISTNCTFGGNAIVKNFCFIGLNATIKSSITIADYSLLGMGCVQNKGTDPLCVYVGNPSRKLENRSSLDTKI